MGCALTSLTIGAGYNGLHSTHLQPVVSILRKLFVSATVSQCGSVRRQHGVIDQKRPESGGGSSTAERIQLIATLNSLDAAGRFAESMAILEQALAVLPDDPELAFAKASTLFDWGRFHEALGVYRRAEALGFEHKALSLQIGWSCFQSGEADQAEQWMRKAILTEPDTVRAHFALATVLRTKGCLGEAMVSYAKCLEQHSEAFDALIGMGGCEFDQGNVVAAEILARRAIAVDPNQTLGWSNLGATLDFQDREDEALEAIEHAEQVEAATGDDVDNFVNLANALLGIAGGLPAALALCERHLPGRPTVVGHGKYSLGLLTAGRLIEGWNHYDFRWVKSPLLECRVSIHRPVWSGQELRGKTILLCPEQGLGDAIQFIRYAPHLKALGATVMVTLEGRTTLTRLGGGFAGIDRIVEGGVPVGEIDYYVHLLSLPRVFGTDLESIPADIPYVNADPLLVERWASRIVADGTLKVGLVWAGNPAHLLDRKRSMKLRTLMPLLMLEGVRFYGLQKGPPAVEAEAMPADVGFVNVGPELDDFADTAAVISQLDLVICVDTAVGHLAGAMGKPVWLLLPQPADFRWLEEREDSPWYPTMRLFRQRGQQDWEEVVRRVEVALRKRVEGDMSQMMPEANRRTRNTRAMVQVANAWPPPGHRPGFSAVAETRVGILQYLPDEPELGVSIGWYGEYLQSQLEMLMQRLQPGMTVMEVAAGVGAHAMLLARMVGATGHLFLYESRPIVRRILQQNLTANRVVNVTLMRRALSRPGASTVDSAGPSGPSTETLDELQLERLDWLKVGDGAIALAVLEGAADALWRLRPQLFLAATDAAMLAQLAQRARDYGYRCWRMETPLFNPANFNRRTDDRFAGRSALALLAIPEEITVNMAFDGGVEL